jgi:ornithine cyclodeaminase/alanine dehydrogenase-like protein (mu-crystallin family)
MRIVELEGILTALEESEALAAVARGFKRHARGETQVPPPMHLAFTDPPGDCHVKGAAVMGEEVFVLKLATTFYRNPEAGLPASNGFMAVMSARTGEMLALLHDRGQLTDLRTAMAGAIAAKAIARSPCETLGVVGAGTQARLQAQWIARQLGCKAILIWARNAERTAALARELGAQAVDLPDLCARADIIVTTTPSTEPLLSASMMRPGARIIAVGADSPGKRELDVQILARARIVVDSRAQCIDHGEAGWAVRAGLVNEASLIELGALLEQPIAFGEDEIVVADLTGVAIQDFEIARSVWKRLTSV